MKEIKLMSMTDFVLEVKKNSFTITEKYSIIEWESKCKSFDKIINYAEFLKQPLKLGMFVPCDEDDNLIDSNSIFASNEKDYIFENEYFYKYLQAKERVLFEGLIIQSDKKDVEFYDGFRFYNETNVLEDMNSIVFEFDGTVRNEKINIVEDITSFNITLTETAIKQLGL